MVGPLLCKRLKVHREWFHTTRTVDNTLECFGEQGLQSLDILVLQKKKY